MCLKQMNINTTKKPEIYDPFSRQFPLRTVVKINEMTVPREPLP